MAKDKHRREYGRRIYGDGDTVVFFSRTGIYAFPRSRRTMYRPSPVYAFLKRGSDVVLSAFFLLLLWFPLFLIAVWVRCDSEGPALFRQTRVGRGLEPFTVYKFRTMTRTAPRNCPSACLTERERYLTRAGRFLRRTGLDELPQLLNVLRGEMSLVGPRPVIPEERELVALRAALGAMAVRPGLTGLAQVNGRDDCTLQQKAYLDALYARTLSPLSDFRILCGTVRTVFRGTGCN